MDNLLQQAIDEWSFSQQDYDFDVREMHAEQAKLLAFLSIARDLRRIVDKLDLLSEVGTGYSGEQMAALHINALR